MTQHLQKLRQKYVLLYTVGTICSLMMIALLVWVAFCIAIEAEPLAALAILPDMPTPLAFVLIFAILALAVASWQYGAKYHQEYESALKKKGAERQRP